LTGQYEALDGTAHVHDMGAPFLILGNTDIGLCAILSEKAF